MLAASILQTLKYSNHFNFPLTLEEIHIRLVGVRSSRLQIITTINQMLKAKSIFQTGDYYHLPGQKSLVALRLAHAKLSAPQLARAKFLATKLSKIPSLLAIYLTGSLAMQNSSSDSDIDLMIITQNSRLWTTRLLLTIYTELLGLRRTPNSTKNSGKICLNLYLTPTTYDLPSTKRSLYTAYELIQAVPLYDPEDTHASLLAANPWIHPYLPNWKGTVPKRNSRLQVEKDSPASEGTVPIVLLFIEKIAYRFQLLYMRRKITRELITPDSAFFHPRDPSPKV